jgi:FkbM family methyltransferase
VLALVVAGLVLSVRAVLTRVEVNRECCRMPLGRNLVVSIAELLGTASYASELGQDKWVLETVFPGEERGYFVDVGSGHGTIGSNTLALERRGWAGLCIDPFPIHMEGRTCRVFKEVVYSRSGERMRFHMAGGLSGLSETLGSWNRTAARAPTVEFTTRTLDEILARAGAPALIHFVSLDIEGAELAALQGFPFERTRVGAFAIEHNREEPKRTRIRELLGRHGYTLTHSYAQDDFYIAVDSHPPAATP